MSPCLTTIISSWPCSPASKKSSPPCAKRAMSDCRVRCANLRISRGLPMPAQITMPQLSDTMTEGTVVKWHKKEGDKVRAGEEIADVETDKATMPMEAYESGTLAHIAVPEGQKVKVGGVLGLIATAGENPADVKKQAASGATTSQPARAAAQAPAPARQPEPVAVAAEPKEERRSI